MDKNILSVRELEEKDITLVADYWFTATPDYLEGMGVDIDRLPTREQFSGMLQTQLALPYPEKKAYALIWELNGEPVGHSNLNPVTYRDHGFMHLHIWKPEVRKMGFGLELVKLSLPYYFNKMAVNKICCEPYALNPAPNQLLANAGFTFIREYITTPGTITFEQPVKRWEILKPL